MSSAGSSLSEDFLNRLAHLKNFDPKSNVRKCKDLRRQVEEAHSVVHPISYLLSQVDESKLQESCQLLGLLDRYFQDAGNMSPISKIVAGAWPKRQYEDLQRDLQNMVSFWRRTCSTLLAQQKKMNQSSYDVVVDMKSLEQLPVHPWAVRCCGSSERKNRRLLSGIPVSIAGLYNRGKTFLLNLLSGQNFAEGTTVHTEGLSFVTVNLGQTELLLIDTAGSQAPIRFEGSNSLLDAMSTEQLLQDVLFDLTRNHIIVVGHMTWSDQLLIAATEERLSSRASGAMSSLIVVHNFSASDRSEGLALWNEQVRDVYSAPGSPLRVTFSEEFGVPVMLHDRIRHICLVRHKDDGVRFNMSAIEVIKKWVTFFFHSENLGGIDRVVSSINRHIHKYVRLPEGVDPLEVGVDGASDLLMAAPASAQQDNDMGNGRVVKKSPVGSFDDALPLRPLATEWFTPKYEDADVIVRYGHWLPVGDGGEGQVAVIFEFELPGVWESDIEFSFPSPQVLKLCGRKSCNRIPGFEQSRQSTVVYGGFEIDLPLPPDVDIRSLSHEMKDGILTVKFLSLGLIGRGRRLAGTPAATDNQRTGLNS